MTGTRQSRDSAASEVRALALGISNGRLGRSSPDKRLRFDDVLLRIGFDGRVSFGDAVEDAASNGVVGDEAEEAFDEIKVSSSNRTLSAS